MGDFVEWLLPKPGFEIALPPISYDYCPNVICEDADTDPLSDEDRSIVWYYLRKIFFKLISSRLSQIASYLFRSSTEISLHHMSGGFSGARVFRVQSQDQQGYEQPLSVLKLGPRTEIAQVLKFIFTLGKL